MTDVTKYVQQQDFIVKNEKRPTPKEFKPLKVEYFKQQISFMLKPCTTLVQRLEQQFKTCSEIELKAQ